jgi:hypothetical protein
MPTAREKSSLVTFFRQDDAASLFRSRKSVRQRTKVARHFRQTIFMDAVAQEEAFRIHMLSIEGSEAVTETVADSIRRGESSYDPEA